MAEDFHGLTDRVGWIHLASGGGRIAAGRLAVASGEISLQVPLDESISALLRVPSIMDSADGPDVPERLVFIDRHGRVGLDGCRLRRSSHRMMGELPPWVEIHADVAVELGKSDHEYWNVSGVRTEIAGLAGWSGLSSVRQTPERDADGLLSAVSVRAESPDPVEVPTEHGVSLYPHFALNASRANGRNTLTEKVFVQTRVDEPIPWADHLMTHQSVQDVVTIAYGWGCGQRATSACSSLYPLTKPRTNEVIGDKWNAVVAVWHGRGSDEHPMEIPQKRLPLFTFGDLGVIGVSRWIKEADHWSRVVGPLAASYFQKHVVVELKVMQVAVALESLGYRIALNQKLIQPGGNLNFRQYLDLIQQTADCDLSQVLRGNAENGVPAFANYAAWAAAFNEVYKQCKHADHPLPDTILGWVLADSGALLARLWLAREFGVSRTTVETNAAY